MIRHIICMGVSATGKTTVGHILADLLGTTFLEGDDLHTQANKDRMEEGIALTDEDRAPWLADIRDWMTQQGRSDRSTVVACSALKREYRDVLRGAEGRVIFVHIKPPQDLLYERMKGRTDHYMGPDQLDDQLETLEPLDSDEEGFTIDNQKSPEDAAKEIAALLNS